MARIRTIKPEHWEEENWNAVSIQAHLLWIGMKNFADDKGVIKDNAVLIKNKVFPSREDIRTTEVNKWITELIENCFLVPFSFESKGYYVLDFSNERIDKPQPSIVPDYVLQQLFSVSIPPIQEHSGTFENTPAVEERKGEERNRKVEEGNTPKIEIYIERICLEESTQWQESMMKKFKITSYDEIKDHIKDFFLTIKAADEVKTDLSDAKSHCSRWIAIKLEKGKVKGFNQQNKPGKAEAVLDAQSQLADYWASQAENS
jgi:hypothetical protein